jgi:hypothetical protein
MKWFYGYGGYFGDPDCTDPEPFASVDEANGALLSNYEVAGPFDTEEEAQAHQDNWLDQACAEANADLG